MNIYVQGRWKWDCACVPRGRSLDAPSIDSAISRARLGVGVEEWHAMQSLQLAELAQHGVDRDELRVYLLPHLHTQTATFVR